MLSTRIPFYGPGHLNLPPSSGLLLVRHAERPPIPTLAEAYFTDLNEAGCAAARAFGKELGQLRTIADVYASPVSRCIHTAQEILRGAFDGNRPLSEVILLIALHFDQRLTGVPGLAGVYLNDNNFNALAAKPTSPEYALLRETLLASLPIPSQPGLINLACTHDVIITFLMASLVGLPSATMNDKPGFLEGIFLVKQNGEIMLG